MRGRALGLAAAALLAGTAGAGRGGERVAPEAHWPLPPAPLEQLLARAPLEVLSAHGGVGGVTGVKKLRVRFPEAGLELDVKWKRAPRGRADGWNNTPRKEIAAYEIQKWFLDPADYVVPTTVVRCLPLEDYAPIGPTPEPTLRDARCVVGTLVVWLENVTVPEKLYDEERFRSDPLYARHLADFNLLTFLIEHEDGRKGNFLVSDLDGERRVFSIDNGVAFGAKVKNWFVRNWNEIRVPALSTPAIERLRRLPPERIDALGVVAELRADDAGILRAVEPSPNRDPKHGARVAPGLLQLGLDRGEIAAVRKRLRRLLEGVDAGRWSTLEP